MKVKLYNNTGFNPVNIPDDALLLGTPFKTFNSVDILQDRFLSSVRVTALYNDVMNADYCQVNNFYYFINGVHMVAYDVAELSLVPDYVTTLGVTNLQVLDGIVERHHVADDSYGEYDEVDPLIVPNSELVLEDCGRHFDNDGAGKTLILSTVDLVKMGDTKAPLEAVTYSDISGEQKVTVPHLWPVNPEQNTKFTMWDITGKEIGNTPQIGGCEVFEQSVQQNVKKGIQRVRDIAAETAIIGQYFLPSEFGETVASSDIDNPRILKVVGFSKTKNIPFNFLYSNVKNKRVLYGEWNKIGLMTADGSSIEKEADQVYENDTNLKILMFADPRPEGRPFYRFNTIDGVTATDNTRWMDAIGGEQWQNVPLVYTDKSGKLIDEVRNSYQLASGSIAQRSTVLNNKWEKTLLPLRIVTGDTTLGGGLKESITGIFGVDSNATQENLYKNSLRSELFEQGVNMNVVIPEVHFPRTAGSLRDYVGNGVFLYRYHPNDKDIQRTDKLLTMYGYKDTTIFEPSFLINRQFFNFIKFSSLSIGNDVPQWFKSGLVEQLINGVRIWHVTPNPVHYLNNPIR